MGELTYIKMSKHNFKGDRVLNLESNMESPVTVSFSQIEAITRQHVKPKSK